MLTIAGGIVLGLIFLGALPFLAELLSALITSRWFWVLTFYFLATLCLLAGINPGGKSIDDFVAAAFFFGMIGTWILLAGKKVRHLPQSMTAPNYDETKVPAGFAAPND